MGIIETKRPVTREEFRMWRESAEPFGKKVKLSTRPGAVDTTTRGKRFLKVEFDTAETQGRLLAAVIEADQRRLADREKRTVVNPNSFFEGNASTTVVEPVARQARPARSEQVLHDIAPESVVLFSLHGDSRS